MAKKTLIVSFEEEHAYLQKSPAYFINKVFGYEISDHHYNILEHFRKHQITLDLGPRGCGKSRIGDIGFCSWVVCNNPNARILIVSDVDAHSIRYLNTIKNVLSTSPLIQKHYGDIIGKQWSDHQITTSLRNDSSIAEASITALGAFSGGVTSGHYDLVAGDDIITFATSRTPGTRQRPKDWWATTVLPTLLPGGEIHVLGTLYHYDDFYHYLKTNLGYDTQIQPAIIDEGTPQARSIWERFMPLHTCIKSGRKVKGLLDIKADLGSMIFGLQYQLSSELQKSGSIFKYDWFQFYTSIPDGLDIFMGVDPAISKSSQADFFAICTVGIEHSTKNIYVLDIARGHYSFDEQVKLIKQKNDEWKPRILGIEQVSYQEALIQHLRDIYSTMRIEPIKTIKDKVSRAYNRSGLFENGKVFVRENMHLLIDELTLFPDGANDDMIDAFDFALTAAEGDVPPAPEDYFLPELAVVDG